MDRYEQGLRHGRAEGRAEGLEIAARWHDDRAGELRAAAAVKRSMVLAAPLLAAAEQHENHAAALRALPLPGEGGEP